MFLAFSRDLLSREKVEINVYIWTEQKQLLTTSVMKWLVFQHSPSNQPILVRAKSERAGLQKKDIRNGWDIFEKKHEKEFNLVEKKSGSSNPFQCPNDQRNVPDETVLVLINHCVRRHEGLLWVRRLSSPQCTLPGQLPRSQLLVGWNCAVHRVRSHVCHSMLAKLSTNRLLTGKREGSLNSTWCLQSSTIAERQWPRTFRSIERLIQFIQVHRGIFFGLTPAEDNLRVNPISARASCRVDDAQYQPRLVDRCDSMQWSSPTLKQPRNGVDH